MLQATEKFNIQPIQSVCMEVKKLTLLYKMNISGIRHMS